MLRRVLAVLGLLIAGAAAASDQLRMLNPPQDPSQFIARENALRTEINNNFLLRDGSDPILPASRLNLNAYPTISVKDYRAVLDGVADDTAALNAAIAEANTQFAAGVRACIYFPPGIMRIVSTTTKFSIGNPGCVVGDGAHKSYIKLDTAFSGDLFAWSEALATGYSPPPTVTPETDLVGPTVVGLGVFGDENSSNTQNAFVFYDRDDQVYFENVTVVRIHGQAISMGGTLNSTNAFVRESYFSNINTYYAGTATLPAIEIASSGTGDTSNNQTWVGLNILHTPCQGIALRNKVATKDIARMRFYSLRAESTGCDAIQIGDSSATYAGGVSNVKMLGTIVNGPASGFYALGLYANSISQQPFDIQFQGAINGQAGNGINVQAARASEFHTTISSTGPNLTVGSSAMVTGALLFNGYGTEINWTTSIDASAAASVVVMPRATFNAGAPGDITYSGILTAAGGIISGSNTFTLNALRANGAATTPRSIRWQTAGVARFTLGLNTAAESGTNSGGDLIFVPFDDSGTALTSAMRINRATSIVDFFNGTTMLPATAPSAPATGWTIYTDSGDSNKLKAKAANGTVVTLGTP